MPSLDDTNANSIENLKRIQLEKDNQINNLNTTIKNKDNFIQEISSEKISLNTKISDLENQLNGKNADLKNLLSEKQAANDSFVKKLNSSQEIIDQKEKSIKELQSKLNEKMTGTGADNQLLTENQKYKIDNEFLNKTLSSVQQSLIDKDLELNLIKTKFEFEQAEKISYKELYLKEHQENIQNKQSLSILNKKLNASFEAAEIANYLTNTIDAFNKQGNVSDINANYIISDMDVELKANIAKNDSNQMLLATPSLSVDSDNAISTIKFSIRAVPKNATAE